MASRRSCAAVMGTGYRGVRTEHLFADAECRLRSVAVTERRGCICRSAVVRPARMDVSTPQVVSGILSRDEPGRTSSARIGRCSSPGSLCAAVDGAWFFPSHERVLVRTFLLCIVPLDGLGVECMVIGKEERTTF